MNTIATKRIVETLGSAEIQKAFDVGVRTVQQAQKKGQFAASWYNWMEARCIEEGIPCPRSAFNWKTPRDNR